MSRRRLGLRRTPTSSWLVCAAVFAAGLLAAGAFGDTGPFSTLSGTSSSTGDGSTSVATSTTTAATTTATTTGSTTAASTTGSAEPAPGGPTAESAVPYIVTFSAGASPADQSAALSDAGATEVWSLTALRMRAITLPSDTADSAAAALRANPSVVSVELDKVREAGAVPSDPAYADQWALPTIGWDQVWGSLSPAGTARLAVLDTGVSPAAGDLDLGAGWSAFGGDPADDPNGHGTAVASIAAAAADNGKGVAGVDFAATTILPVQVLGPDGLGQDSDIIQGVVWAADHGADVILMAFSNPGYSPALQAAVDYAWDQGAVIVASTGNDGASTPTFPAGDAKVVGVSATTQADGLWSGSNHGADTFIAAPGVGIRADAVDGTTTAITGTSASAALVAGAAALLAASDAAAANGVVVGRLARNADAAGTVEQTGNGRLNLARALSDTSSEPVVPEGVAPNGDGGPLVGPYVAGARNWTLTFAGTGGGSVTITPSTGTVNAPVGCGGTGTNAASQTVTGTCSPNISTSDNGATVTFSAAAGGGSVFAGWSAQANLSSSTCTGTTSPCSAVLGGNAALTVTFNGASADLSIAKSGPATVLAGNTITYTLTAANGGPDPAQSVVVADTLPAVLSGAQFCVGSGCTPGAAWTGSAGLGTIVSGGSTTVTVTATVPAGTADGTVLSNQATVSSDTADPVPANNTSATLATTVHTSADLSIAKSGPASATAGASAGFDYTLTVANGGPSDESGGFHVTDTLPAGASFQATGSSAGCAAVGQVVTCSHAAGLAAGANASFTVHVEVASSVAEGAVLSNSATVASDGTNDPAAGNDTSNTVATTVHRSADLSVEKSDGVASVTAGDGVTRTYTITVANAGPSDAGGVGLSDTWPAGFAQGTVTPSQGSCTGAPSFTCALGTIAAGASATVTASYTVPSSTTGSQTNTATASSVDDPDTSTNTGTDTNAVTTSADLSIAKTGPSEVFAGDTLTYTLTVSNGGPSDAQSVVVGDSLPPLLSGALFCVGSGCTPSDPWPGSLGTGTLAAGADEVVRIRAAVPADTAAGTHLLNTATAGSPTDAASPTSSNTLDTTVHTRADVSVTKTDEVASVLAGAATVHTYTLTVHNAGPSDAQAVSLSDSWPSGFTRGTVTTSQGTCDTLSDPADFTCDLGTIPASATATVTAEFTVPASALGDQTNTATVSTSTDDPDTGNDSASDTDAVDTSADLSIAKLGPATVTAGESITYTLTVQNAGESDAQSVHVTDALPAGTSGATYSVDGGPASPYGGSVALGTLAAGATTVVSVTADVAPGVADGSHLLNQATVSSATSDPQPADNTSEQVDTLVEAHADLADVKVADTSVVVAGTSVTYTITVGNSGPSDAQAAQLSDVLDPSLGSPTYCLGTGCDAGAGAPFASPLDLGTLPAGGSVVVRIRAALDSSRPDGPLDNTAVVGSSTSDPDTGNNTSSETVTVETSADLSIVKDGPSDVTAGTSITYTLTVHNDGPSDAQSVVVTDGLPAGTSAAGYSVDAGPAAPYGGSVALGTVAAGATHTISITAAVGADVPDGATLSNEASVAGATDDPDAADNTSALETAVHASADLSIAKEGPATIVAGTALTYTLVVSNGGPSDAQDVEVTDTLPTGTSGATYSVDGGPSAGYGGSIAVGTLAAGTTATITITASTSPSLAEGSTLSNQAHVSSTTHDPVSGNDDSDTVVTIVETRADLTIAKDGPAAATAGDPDGFDYTTAVSNAGPSDQSGGFTVTDTLDDGLTFDAGGSDAGCSAAGQVVTCSTADGLAAGADRTFTVHVTLASTVDGGVVIENAASVTSNGTIDPTGPNTSDTVQTEVVEDVHLHVTKAFQSETATAGGAGETFTITVSNSGLSDADNLVLTDAVPAELVVDSIDEGSLDCSTSLGQSISCTLEHLAANGGEASITVGYHVAFTTDTAPGTGNTAYAASDEASASGNDSVDIVEDVQLSVAKAFGSAQVTAGGAAETFTLTLHNAGASDADGVVLDDTIDGRLIVQSIDGGGLTCDPPGASLHCTLANLDPNETRTVTVTYEVDTATDSGTVSNDASLESDEDSAGSDAATVEIVEDVHLAVQKTFASDTVVAGGADETFTVDVTNDGVSDADDVTVTDAVDPRLVVTDVGGGGGFSCGSPDQSISCTLDHLPAGETRTITVTYHVDSTTQSAAAVPNSAHAVSDEDTAGDTGADTVDIVEDVQLHVTKTFQSIDATAGGSSETFTIAVSNSGLSDADDVEVSDAVDPRLQVDSIDGGGFSCEAPSQAVSCALDHLAAGSTATITVTYGVSSTTDGDPSVPNEASVASEDGSAGPSAAAVAIVEDVDLSVVKEFGSATATAGGAPESFTITVSNAGVSDADGVHLTDLVPARLVVDQVTPGAFDCSAGAGQQVDCSLVHLAPGADASVTVTYHVDTATEADPGVLNTAAASSDESLETTGAGSVAIVEDVVLDATKSFAEGAVDAGTTGHTFTIAVQNTGVSEADNLSVTDTVDARLIVTAVDPGGFTCPDGDGDAQTLTCTVAHLAAGATGSIVVTYRVATSTPAASVSNTADATADDGGADSSVVAVSITTHADVADLKVISSGPHIAGTTVTYTSTVSNNGPSDAQAVTFSDTLDPHLTGPVFCVDTGSGCTPADPWTGSVALGAIAAGDSVAVVVQATIAASTPQGYELDNTSTALSSETADPTAANNSDTVSTTVETRADLSVVKTGPATAIAGDPAGFDYTITVSNAGPSDQSGGFDVVDTLAAGLTFQAAGSDPACSAVAGTVTCSNATGLPVGGTQTFVVHVRLAASAADGAVLANAATVSSNGTLDPASGNDASSPPVETSVQTRADLSVVKSDGVESVVAGDGVTRTYTITVANAGPSDATGVSIADTWPAGFSRGTVTPSQGTCAGSPSFGCSLGTVAAGGSATVSVTYTVPSATTGSQTNTVAVSSATTDPDTGNDSAADTNAVITSADLSIAKSDGVTTVTADGVTVYTFTITAANAGPSDATGVLVHDTWPAGYDRGSMGPCYAVGSDFECSLGTIVAGGAAAVTVSYTVPATTTTSQTNTAAVSSGVGDPAPTNDTAADTNAVRPNTPPDVTIVSPVFGSTYAKGSAGISPLTLNATFTDPDAGQTFTWTVDWDDAGAQSTGAIGAAQPKEIAATHAYVQPGVYTITVTVCDNAIPHGCSTTSIWIVVYDPNGGFVTGGGWIDVGAGSYTPNPALTGRANFGFNSQYKKNATVPTGQTEFNFQVGKLNFHSEAYTWLAVSGYKAQYKGTGTINGSGSYQFTLTAYDGKLTGGGGVDRFRIRITDGNNGNAVIFDNRSGAPTDMDTADPQAISGGSITIHK